MLTFWLNKAIQIVGVKGLSTEQQMQYNTASMKALQTISIINQN